MTSKRAFLNSFTKFNDRKRGFYLNKTIVLGVFLSQRSPWIIPSAKRKKKIWTFRLHEHFLTKLLLTLQNDSH